MSDESVDGLVTLTERTVNLVNQLNMPLVEVSLVLQKHLNQLMNTLNQHLASTGETVGARVRAPWPVEVESTTSSVSFDLEKVMNIVDHQRMDILDTLIRVTLVEINASVIDAIEHALTTLGDRWDYVVLLQPTSPLRLGSDIDGAVRLCHQTGAPSVIGVSPVLKPQTFYGRVKPDRTFRPNAPEPDEPVVINGAVYVGRPDVLLERRSFQGEGALGWVMPPERG